MLDLPDLPLLDKERLLGGCVRLPLAIDAQQLLADVAAIPASFWGSQGGRVGVHVQAEAVFLRGYAPAEGERPILDREALAHTPYIRELITARIPAPPLRCLLAKLKPQGYVGLHIDKAPYFAKTLRLHFPIVTSPQALMFCAGRVYRMHPGEAWVLNNSAVHGVLNGHPTEARTHLICDFAPTPELLALVAAGNPGLGAVDPAAEQILLERHAHSTTVNTLR